MVGQPGEPSAENQENTAPDTQFDADEDFSSDAGREFDASAAPSFDDVPRSDRPESQLRDRSPRNQGRNDGRSRISATVAIFGANHMNSTTASNM